MTGLILINAYADMHALSSQARRLQEELTARGVPTHVRRNGDIPVSIAGDGTPQVDTGDYAFCIYLDKDKYTSRLLEQSGLRLYNPHRGIQICDDKMDTFLHLTGKGIPMPRTVPAPLCYYPGIPPREEFLDGVAATLGLPLVVKECYGSLGAQVYLARTREELTAIDARLQGRQHLYQEYVAHSAGRDIRAIVIGGRVTAAMQRVSATDFRSNIELGGVGSPIHLPAEAAALCERAAALLELDYCGVDILYGPHGFLLCEVNSNAFFEGIEAVTGCNVAGAYADHILRSL